jgi:RimJ/RimL family protein N-acetyltransferase
MNSQDNTRPARPLINIEGEKVALGPLARELIPLYQKWDTDFEINRTTNSARPVTLEEETDAYERYVRDKSIVLFTIYERGSWRPIGKTYLSLTSHSEAEFGIVIGERDCQGKGYGTEATRLVLDYGFTVLGLHNIMLTVFEYNLAGIKAYEKAGFGVIGRRRQARWMNGRYWDVIYMDCVADEFKSPVLAKLFL